MKHFKILLFALLTATAGVAQPVNSDQIAFILLIQDKNGQPVTNQKVTAQNKSNSEDKHEVFTNSEGRATFRLQRGMSYDFGYLETGFDLSTPTAGQSFMTKKVIYEGVASISTKMDTIKITTVPKKPTETEAHFTLIIKDKSGKLLPNLKVWLVQPSIKKAYENQTNSKGEAIFLLPIGYDYTLNFEKDANYRTFTVPKLPNLQQKKGITYHSNFVAIAEVTKGDTIFQQVPPTQQATKDRVLLEVTVYDLDQAPLEDEMVYLQGADKVFSATTGKDGKAFLLIPKGGSYAVNFEFSDSLEVLHFEKGNYTRKDNIRYRYIGSKAIKERIRERERQQTLWDSLSRVQSFRDSLAASRSEFSGFSDKIKDKQHTATLNDLILKRAEEDRKKLVADPKYFEKVGDEVAATFFRNQAKWKDKIIVTDLTCSMYPYLDQVLSWHVLENNQRKKENYDNQYLFFNDGDGKEMSEKIIGKTGGFHYTTPSKLEDLTWTMLETMQTGCSGDGPENDLEALLEAVKNRKNPLTEIILIADNNSDIRDFELLSQLKIPIRVILAGAEWFGANEQYLELAHKTKGSVHTLETDLERLYEMNDGDYVQVGSYKYRIFKGKFLKMGTL